MLKKMIIGFYLLTCFFLFAQEVETGWKIVQHVAKPSVLEEQINEMVETGYLPTGIDVKDNEFITVLYAKGGDEIKHWMLRYFDDMQTLQEECTSLIDKGWIPGALSCLDGGVFLLFTDRNLKISGWTITRSEAKLPVAKAVLKRYIEQGFSCYGISAGSDGKFWYLFLQTSAVQEHEWLVTPADPARVSASLDEFFALGWIPSGLFEGESNYNFLLLK